MERACTVTIDSVETTKPVTENMMKMVNKPTYCPSSSSSQYRLLEMWICCSMVLKLLKIFYETRLLIIGGLGFILEI